LKGSPACRLPRLMLLSPLLDLLSQHSVGSVPAAGTMVRKHQGKGFGRERSPSALAAMRSASAPH
jgi:hypothetical protein